LILSLNTISILSESNRLSFIFVYSAFLFGAFVNSTSLSAQQYDPLEGLFVNSSEKSGEEDNPKKQKKNWEEWLELNLAYAPAGGLVQHTGGYSYTWLEGASVVWKGPNEGKRIFKNNVVKDIEPLLPYAAPKCVCIFNHEISNKEYLDFVTDVLLEKMRQLNPRMELMDKDGNFSDSFLSVLQNHFLRPDAFRTKLATGKSFGRILSQYIKDTVTNKEKMLHELLAMEKITYNGIPVFPDVSGWKYNVSTFSWNDPMALYYMFHPSYSSYPVCSLLQPQAMAYCQWLSKQLSGLSGKEVVVSLPTEMEWIQAACYENNQRNSYYKPSINKYWRNEKGVYIANHVGYREPQNKSTNNRSSRNKTEQAAGENTLLNSKDSVSNNGQQGVDLSYVMDGGLYATPVFSYWPNDAGCYNIFGNVAEMTSTTVGDMMVVKGGSFLDVGDVLFPGSRALVYTREPLPMVGFRPVVKIR
jgi:formylglycine-generating enzyme required for sulfatase activity